MKKAYKYFHKKVARFSFSIVHDMFFVGGQFSINDVPYQAAVDLSTDASIDDVRKTMHDMVDSFIERVVKCEDGNG